MRWKEKEYRDGEKRVVKRFLFFPKLIEGEWRWLELVRIEQQFDIPDDSMARYMVGGGKWYDIRFL